MLTDDELAARCARVRAKNNWPTAMRAGEVNTDYIEGMDLDGSPNENRKNAFDDLHVIWGIVNGGPKLLFKAECTTQPGARYTMRPINEEGAAIIALGYQECWQDGSHRGNYRAFIQTGAEITVWRDNAHTYTRGQLDRAGRPRLCKGWFGINQHHGANADRSDIGSHSAGCLVTRLVAEHERACQLKRLDPRWQADHRFVHGAAIMTAAQVLERGDAGKRPRPSVTPDPPKGLWPSIITGFSGLGGSATTFASEHWLLLFIIGVGVAIGLTAYLSRAPFGKAYKNDDV